MLLLKINQQLSAKARPPYVNNNNQQQLQKFK